MNILETLQKIAATTERLDMALTQIERERAERRRFEDAITARMERTEGLLSATREGVTRLEASREADRSQMAAELARFKAEVERAEVRLARLSQQPQGPRALPDTPG